MQFLTAVRNKKKKKVNLSLVISYTLSFPALGHIRKLLGKKPVLEEQAFYLNKRSQPPKLEAEQ